MWPLAPPYPNALTRDTDSLRFPWFKLCLHFDRETIKRNLGIGSLIIEAGTARGMVKTERRFDDPGHSGCGFQVSDVGLDGSDSQRKILGATMAQYVGQRSYFDRITKRCSGAVRFDILDLGGSSRAAS